jgi:hypothetical protein
MFILVLNLRLKAEINLKKTDEWKSDYLVHGEYRGSFINENNELIIMFFKHGILRVKKGKTEVIAKEGRGPGEIFAWRSLCQYQKGFADIELYRKIQIFDLKKGDYRWVKNIWRDEKLCTQYMAGSLFLDNKWILSGGTFSHENREKEKQDVFSPYFMRILNKNGKFIKRLVRLKFKEPIRSYLYNSFLGYDKDNIYLAIETNLNVYVIDRKKYIIKKRLNLPVPECYKKIPKRFYAFRRKRGERKSMQLLYEEWKTNYSIITNFKVMSDYFIIQIRNFGKKSDKKFALLFYDKKTLKLKQIIHTNDFLLNIKKGRLYFYKNGIPPFDDEADSLSINIYKFEER